MYSVSHVKQHIDAKLKGATVSSYHQVAAHMFIQKILRPLIFPEMLYYNNIDPY